MSQSFGHHLVKSGYGLWLPGDSRGHWSEAWDELIGYHSPHTLNLGDPVRERMARERMRHPPVRLSASMRSVVVQTLRECESESDWRIAALAVEPTHFHLLMTYNPRDFDRTAKWLGQQLTKAIHDRTPHAGPVWAEGKWCVHIADESHWENTFEYIRRHAGRVE